MDTGPTPVVEVTGVSRENQQYPNNFKVTHVLAAGTNFYPRWDAALAERLVEQFELPVRRQVQKLSRGMRTTVGTIVGLASRAELTIFDEPYLGLDATARTMFYDLLLEQYAEEPRAVILSTHLIDEISSLLEDVLVLDHGRIVLEGSAEDLRARACWLTALVLSVGFATLFLLLQVAERSSGGWWLQGQFFWFSWFSRDAWPVTWLLLVVSMVATFGVGAVAAALWARYRIGALVAGVPAAILLLGGALALVVSQDWWSAIGDWFTGLTPLTATLWCGVLALACLGGTWAALRRVRAT